MSSQSVVPVEEPPGRDTDRSGAGVRAAVGTRFRCTATTLPSPAGDIVVLRIAGDLDLGTLGLLRGAVTAALVRRPDHLVVDLAGVTFCGAGGLALLVEAGGACAAGGTHYALSSCSARADRLWDLLWPADELPARHPTARLAVLAAMAGQAARVDRVRRPARSGGPARRLTAVPDPVPARDTDRLLAEQARAGDVEAYRVLVRRHRTGMYRSALHALGVTADPDDVAEDIAGRLRHALELFARADPS